MFLAQLLTVAIVHLLAVMSPGPDFAVVTKNSLIHSRKIALYTSVGIALGIGVHVAYSILGIGFIISQSIVLFNIIKYAGAAYLIYIGVKSLFAKPALGEKAEAIAVSAPKDKTVRSAVWTGFLTNVLNPKATLFFLALFTQVIDPATPKYIQLALGGEMMILTFAWFALVSILFSHKTIKAKITRVQHHIERVTGGVLIALGVKVALVSKG